MTAMHLDAENPWPGLESFEENESAFFFGRDREALSLLRHVLDAPVTVFYGRSGLGKTSLLQAGLFPLLRDRHFLPVDVRFDLKPSAVPLSRQLHQFVYDAVRAEVPDATLPSEEESLWEYLHRADVELWSARNYLLTPVIVLDQFEELFTLGQEVSEVVRVFMNDLGDLAENRIPADLAARIDDDETAAERFHLASQNYKLLISLREDLLPDLEGWRQRIPALARSRLRLLCLRGHEALDAVRKPAALLMSGDLPERIVRFVAGEDLRRRRDTARVDVDHHGDDLEALEVEPALLSLFCRELNEERKRRGQPRFDEQLVEEAKGDILSNYYSSCVRDLSEAVADFIESELITGKGFRNSYAREDAVPSRLTEDELDRLIRSRLLRLEEYHGAQRIELTHDVLTGVVREHRDRRRAEARVEQEQRAARELAAAEAERQVAREKERTAVVLRKRSRILMALLAFTLVVALVAVYGFVTATNARKEADVARQQAEASNQQADLSRQKSDQLQLALSELRAAWPPPRSQPGMLPQSQAGQLLAMVPSADHCTPSNAQINAVASVDCSPGVAAVSSVGYTLFPDQAALDRYFGYYVHTAQPCPDLGQSPQNWHRAANPQQTEGRVACWVDDGVPRLGWTVHAQLLFGSASGPKGGTIDQVYQWWANRYQV